MGDQPGIGILLLNPGSGGDRLTRLPVNEVGIKGVTGGRLLILGRDRLQFGWCKRPPKRLKLLGVEAHLQQTCLQQGRNRQQRQRVADHIANAQLDTVEIMGAIIAIGAHRCPEVARVKHNARCNLGFGPVDVVLVAGKKRYLLGCGREQLPTARMRPCNMTIPERRGCTERQVQRGFSPNQTAGLKE